MSSNQYGEPEITLQDVSFEEERVHDQLPTVDEMKVNVAPTRNSRRTLVTLLGITTIAVVIFAIIGVVVRTKKADQNAARLAQHFDDVISFLSNHTDPNALTVPSSPQRRAAEWMAYESALQRKIPTDKDREWKFLQRYALVVLYFATQDDNPWTYPQLHFASPKRHECNWNHPFQSLLDSSSTSSSTFTMGVICNDEKQVQKLIIDGNGLNGVLPPEISLLQHLVQISLDGNELVGSLPSSLGRLTKLRSLTLTYNNIESTLPTWLGHLTKLSVLGLANNRFHGHLPSALTALKSIKTLALDDNLLVGGLSVLAQLGGLEELYLDNNVFTGKLDPLVNLEKLRVLDVSSNSIHGHLPIALLRLTTLRIVDVHDNKLRGPLPQDMPHASSLSFLALHGNYFNETIPTTINRLSQTLQHLDLSSNRFTGDIPSSLGDLTKLEYLVLANNVNLSRGPLPDLAKLTNLVELSFQHTNRTGILPNWLGDLSNNLVVLDLGENHLSGVIPTQLSTLSSLELLFLHRNKLTGTLPTELSRLSSLALFAMDKNSIVGSAGPMCDLSSLQVFVADCGGGTSTPEFECPCCSQCCQDDNAECNKDLLLISYNPTWEDGYKRRDYIVSHGLMALAPPNDGELQQP